MLERMESRLAPEPLALRRGVLSLAEPESTRSVMACSRERADEALPRAETSLDGRGLASERPGEALLRSRRGILSPRPVMMS